MPPLHVDDITPILNISQRIDLEDYLCRCPPRVRIGVALARAEISSVDWAERVGLASADLAHWLAQRRKMPLGAAMRLSRCLGIDPVVLFAFYL